MTDCSTFIDALLLVLITVTYTSTAVNTIRITARERGVAAAAVRVNAPTFQSSTATNYTSGAKRNQPHRKPYGLHSPH
jgi:hypothetical protein|eukprot:m.67377 g.67377  ORF g.67377 m.67377 type:complete len:78 (-) comp18188_c0_seq2:685-918(-)